MKNAGTNIKHSKLRGEWADLRFMAGASEQGLCVNKPWGDNSRYDFAVEHVGKFLRVQVKSPTCRRGRSYVCCFRGTRGQPYGCNQIDFIAAYVIPKNIWYIFPIEAIVNISRNVVLSPHLKTSKYGPYQDAWHLLRGEENPKPSAEKILSRDFQLSGPPEPAVG